MIFQDVHKNAMQAYIKYKAYCKKTIAKKTQTGRLRLYLTVESQSASKSFFRDFRWVGPYIIEMVFSNKNYLVRRMGTNKTEVFH